MSTPGVSADCDRALSGEAVRTIRLGATCKAAAGSSRARRRRPEVAAGEGVRAIGASPRIRRLSGSGA